MLGFPFLLTDRLAAEYGHDLLSRDPGVYRGKSRMDVRCGTAGRIEPELGRFGFVTHDRK